MSKTENNGLRFTVSVTQEATTEHKKRGKGRPKATHNKVRFTTLLDPDLRDKMNIIRGLAGYEVNQMFNEAVQEYINKYQQENPSPNLDKLLNQRKE